MLDDCDYAMHGKIFAYNHEPYSEVSTLVNVFASFGGLLMSLKGEQRTLAHLEKDMLIYVMIKKISI